MEGFFVIIYIYIYISLSFNSCPTNSREEQNMRAQWNVCVVNNMDYTLEKR